MSVEIDAKIHSLTFRERLYAMKKHKASSLHYDLRLELNGRLLSWAIPAGPDRNSRNQREAIQMEDHRSKYIAFEGIHRTGPFMMWDRGTWEPHLESDDIERSLRCGILRFILRAEKLQGGWTLAKTNRSRHGRALWSLRKDEDAFAVPGVDNLLEQRPNSVTDERTMEAIVQQWETRSKDPRQHTLPFELSYL